jgi:hypothetical protein
LLALRCRERRQWDEDKADCSRLHPLLPQSAVFFRRGRRQFVNLFEVQEHCQADGAHFRLTVPARPALQLEIHFVPLDGTAARANMIFIGFAFAPFDAQRIDAVRAFTDRPNLL